MKDLAKTAAFFALLPPLLLAFGLLALVEPFAGDWARERMAAGMRRLGFYLAGNH